MKSKIYKSALLVALIIIGVGIGTYTSHTSEKGIHLLFVGDMMFDRTMRNVAEAKGYDYLFSCVDRYLDSFDMVIGNLEGPITENPSLSTGTKPGGAGNTTFTFDRDVARALSHNNIRMVSLGNNHIYDFGAAGARSTMNELKKRGVEYFGAPNGSMVATTTVRGVKLAFVSFNQFLGQNDPEKTKDAVAKIKGESDFVAVYSHWGEEYSPATDYEKKLAREFIDAGADMVVGSHPHVIQEHEIYKGKHIFYSLGNFIFDQYWTESVRTGGGVEALVGNKVVLAKDVEFEISRGGKTCLKTTE